MASAYIYRSSSLSEGGIARARGQPSAALASVRNAINEARVQEAPWLELLALVDCVSTRVPKPRIDAGREIMLGTIAIRGFLAWGCWAPYPGPVNSARLHSFRTHISAKPKQTATERRRFADHFFNRGA